MDAERRARTRLAALDTLGLFLITLGLADYLRPSLLLAPTLTAGGDTPCHYPTAVFLHDYLLPRLAFRLPGPLLGAGAAFAFLLAEENPIWGGTRASTLAGEFSYTYGIGL